MRLTASPRQGGEAGLFSSPAPACSSWGNSGVFRRGSRDVQLPPPTAGSVFMLLKLAMATATGEPCAWPRGAAIVAASPPRRCCPRWTAARTLGGASRSSAGGSAGPRPGLSSSWRSCRWCNVTGGRDLAGTAPFSAGRYRLPRVGAGDRMFPREPFMRRRRIAKIGPPTGFRVPGLAVRVGL